MELLGKLVLFYGYVVGAGIGWGLMDRWLKHRRRRRIIDLKPQESPPKGGLFISEE